MTALADLRSSSQNTTIHLSRTSFSAPENATQNRPMMLSINWPPPKEPIQQANSVQQSLDKGKTTAGPAMANAEITTRPTADQPCSINRLPAKPSQRPSPRKDTQGPTVTGSRQRGEETHPPAPKKVRPTRDDIVPPSKQSGGVPEPSPQYLLQSMGPSYNTGILQPILLVIDLNGTILHRPSRATPTRFIERPYTPHFLHYVFSNFSVMVWSSARPENVSNMCKRLFTSSQRQHLVAEWGRDRLGLSETDYQRRVQAYKRLQIVWNDPVVQHAHPLATIGRYWDASNTILIDDSVEKARSELFNLLLVPEFDGRPENPDILRKVAEYLDVVKLQSHVAAFIRANPLRLDTRQPVFGAELAQRPPP